MAPATASSLPAANSPLLGRNVTSTTADSDSSVVVSPSDSPYDSPSSTSLSALASDDAAGQEKYGKLIDTYGNEFQMPDFTIKDIRNAIPKHCYKRSAVRSMGYVFHDMIYLATTFYV